MPAAHQVDVRLQVGRHVPHVRLEARDPAHLLGEVAGRRARGLHHPRQATRVGDRAHVVAAGWEAEAERIHAQLLAVEVGRPRRRVRRVLLGDDEVVVARPHVVQAGLGLAHRDLDAQVGVVVAEDRERRRHEREQRRLERRHADGAGHVRERRVHLGLGPLQPFQQRGRVLHEDLGLRREHHPPADAAQERDAGLALQLRELLRHRRRAERQRVSDRADRAAELELAQEPQPSHLEHVRLPVISGERGIIGRTAR